MRCVRTLVLLSMMSIVPAASGGVDLGGFTEREPNNDSSTAQAVFQSVDRGCTVSQNGVFLLGPGDQDWFVVQLAAGERLQVVTTPLTTIPSVLDTQVTILDSSFDTLAFNDDAGSTPSGLNSGSVVRFAAPLAGTYYVRVERVMNSTGRYLLLMTLDVPSCADGIESVNPNSNNTPAEADVLVLGRGSPLTVRGTASIMNPDYFAVDLLPGDSLTATTIPGNADFSVADTVMELLAPDGISQLAESDDDLGGQFPQTQPVGSTIIFRPTTAGRYFLLVQPFSGTTAGMFKLVATVGQRQFCDGDANGDGAVSFDDITRVLLNFNRFCN